MNPKLTVIVCTYNRGDLITETLPTLFNQDVSQNHFKVIIVNNNSTDHTSDILQKFSAENSNLTVVEEKKQGLSHAKNTGMRHTETDWIVYLDDDAKVPVDFIRKALSNIDSSKFSCFGGVYLPWYKYGKPKWYKDNYSSNSNKLVEFGVLKTDYISGGIMAIKKNLLLKYDGFSTAVGMKGKNIAYGEETLLQIKLRQDGYEIGYDPNWIIYHLVGKYKLSIWWFLKSSYASGKDSWIVYQLQPSIGKLFLYLFRSVKLFFINLYKSTIKLLNSDYYVQNWTIDLLRPTVIMQGQIVGGIKLILNKNANK